MRRSLPAAGAVLTLLFVVMEPSASAGYGVLGRAVFWSVHVGVGLLGILVASMIIRHTVFARWHPLLAIATAGALGALIVAPLFVVIESLLPVSAADDDGELLEAFAAEGPGQAILAEYLEVLPVLVMSWAAVNLPLLLRWPGPGAGGDDPGGPDAASSPHDESSNPDKIEFLRRLPTSLGNDIVAISSDLHYLHVFTTQGRAMVIGSLRDAALIFADEGMLVHKSHWVCHAHVLRYVAAEQRANCIMSNGIKVPVSRRRRKDVKAMYGDHSTVRLASVSKQG
ncbi:MAG: LytTR family DNA-binding domain-containing protein [Pseudomonadota bacterium]